MTLFAYILSLYLVVTLILTNYAFVCLYIVSVFSRDLQIVNSRVYVLSVCLVITACDCA